MYVGVGAGFVQRGVKYEKKKKQKKKAPQNPTRAGPVCKVCFNIMFSILLSVSE